MTPEEEIALRDVTDRLMGERTSHITLTRGEESLKVRRWDGMCATFILRGLGETARREMIEKARGFANLGPNGQRATAVMELTLPFEP